MTIKINRYKLSILAIFFIALNLSGCFSHWHGNLAKVVISFGGAGREIVKSNIPYNPNSNATIQNLKHEIVFSNKRETITFKHEGTADFESYIAPGNWTVWVYSWLNDEIWAAGFEPDVKLQAGQENILPIEMYEAIVVKFDSQGGNEIPDQIARKGFPVVKPSDPKRGGLKFIDWYTDKDFTEPLYNFDENITSGFTLYAKWNIWWKWDSSIANGNNYDSKTNVEITYSNNTDCAVTVNEAVPGGGANDGEHNWASQVGCNYNATVGKTYKVSWTWKADDDVFENVTIRYAQEVKIVNGEETFPNADQYYELGTNTDENRLTVPNYEETKTYYFIMPDSCKMNFTFMVGADTGSFKIWDFKIEEINHDSLYKVSFNANGGSGKVTPPIPINHGGSIILPSDFGISRDGYTFGGWSTVQNGTKILNAGTEYIPIGNITLWAVWQQKPPENAFKLSYWWTGDSKHDSDAQYESMTKVTRKDLSDGSKEITVDSQNQTVNPIDKNWGSQVGCQWDNAIPGNTYKVTWDWYAKDNPFKNVTIQFAEVNAGNFPGTSELTIPTTQETKTYYFIMPYNGSMNFHFFVGSDTGVFYIRNFKIEEVSVTTREIVKDGNPGSTNGLATPVSSSEIADIPTENRYDVMIVSPTADQDKDWAVVMYNLSAYKNEKITITISVDVKRAGYAGTLAWQIDNKDEWPTVVRLETAQKDIWYSMSGQWTGKPTEEYPHLYLTTYQNNSDGTTYYIDNFNITITVD